MLILIFIVQSCADGLSKDKRISRLKADNVIKESLSGKTKNNDYIVFSSGDEQYVILIKESDSLHEYFIDRSIDKNNVHFLIDTVFKSDSYLFKKMFDVGSYMEGYISFDSDFYKNGYDVSSGRITYFVYVSNTGKRFGEARLSFFISPNPIDPEIYLYFTGRILKYARGNN